MNQFTGARLMDTLRSRLDAEPASEQELDEAEYEADADLPPAAIGQDERRMQVRAYNQWATLLENRNYPSIEDLDPAGTPDFAPNSVLLDFTIGVENPRIAYLGSALAAECGADPVQLKTLSDVPGRSLLSRITDHYMQILANQAPIGFEAEFTNHRGATVMYRGILLPYSSDDDAIDFIYGVINSKELADQHDTDELLLAVDQALEETGHGAAIEFGETLSDWADGPGSPAPDAPAVSLSEYRDLPRPSFGIGTGSRDEGGQPHSPLAEKRSAMPAESATLADMLASARSSAEIAQACEDRTRQALYSAIGHAYDFSLAAAAAPQDFAELVTVAGITVQERAPMTPVIKLIFGADYDKTRITEYATALSHAHRLELPQGSLGDFIASSNGGLKELVATERRLRRAEAGKGDGASDGPRKALAKKLRAMPPVDFSSIGTAGSEFALVIIHRSEAGGLTLLGEVPDDPALVERAARRLIG